MFIGNSYIIPAISNLPGQSPRTDGFAFEFKKDQESWFEAENSSVANYGSVAISCWIKLPDSFFVDIDPGPPGTPPPPPPYIFPTETQHILDKYSFLNGIPSGYRLILEKGVNQQSGGYEVFSARVNDFLAADAELVTADDSQLRFHSGVPAA